MPRTAGSATNTPLYHHLETSLAATRTREIHPNFPHANRHAPANEVSVMVFRCCSDARAAVAVLPVPDVRETSHCSVRMRQTQEGSGSSNRARQLDRALRSIIPRKAYSWHSARIGLACRLLAAGATSAQIQALCRWQTEDSLRVYARLNPDKYNALLASARTADPSSVSTASPPPLSDELALRQLLGFSLRDVETIPADGPDA